MFWECKFYSLSAYSNFKFIFLYLFYFKSFDWGGSALRLFSSLVFIKKKEKSKTSCNMKQGHFV